MLAIAAVALLLAAAVCFFAGTATSWRRACRAAETDRDNHREAARHARAARDEAIAERDVTITKNRQLAEQVRRMSER